MEDYNIIVANGHLPRTRRITNLIEKARHVIVCDGGINNYFSYTSRIPDFVVGDGDSVNRTILLKRNIPFVKLEDQETNDLTKALMFGMERGWNGYVVIGATGGREDHSLANIFLLGHYLDMGIRVWMVGVKGYFVPFKGLFDEKIGRKRVISIFSIDNQPVTASGLEFPVQNRTFRELWEGSLNKSVEDRVRIECPGRVILFIGKKASKASLEEDDDFD